jgi:drug/metabolite transporter (DMT)-like permease
VSRRNVLLFVLLCALFGFAFVTIKTGLRYADPIFLIAIRFWGAGAVLMLVAAVMRRSLRIERSDLPWIVLLGITNSGLVGLFLFLGTDLVSAGLSSILLYTYPLMAAGVAVAFLGEGMTWSRGFGLALGFAGIVLVANGSTSGSVLGVVYLLLAAANWAVGTVILKTKLERRDMLMVSIWSMIFGAALLQVLSALLEGVPNVEPATGFWLSFLYLAIPGMAVPGFLWYYLLDQGEATVASAYLFLTPLFGVFFGWLALDDAVTWVQLAGGALVGAGIYLVNRRTASKRAVERRRQGTASARAA